MAMTRNEVVAVTLAAMVAVGAPLSLLGGHEARPVLQLAPLTIPQPQPLASVYRRALFTAAVTEAEPPADAPALAGIVGRIGRDAVALVRSGEGTRTIVIGESIDGWRLDALTIDAASFSRGGQSVRVPLPAGE